VTPTTHHQERFLTHHQAFYSTRTEYASLLGKQLDELQEDSATMYRLKAHALGVRLMDTSRPIKRGADPMQAVRDDAELLRMRERAKVGVFHLHFYTRYRHNGAV
jgi:hypothetical protein